jgi:prolipoprotein diacylglyceryl transferase
MNPVAFRLGTIEIYWYGIIIALAVSVAYLVARRLGKGFGLPGRVFDEFLLWVVPISFIGARLWYVLFNLNYYLLDPAKIFAFREGGLAIHGAILAGLAVALFRARAEKINFYRFADISAVALVLGQAIGRWANFVNQEAYGGPSKLPWAMYIAGEYRHPTFLYESLWDLALFVSLFYYLNTRPRSGKVLGLYLAGYSLGRYFIEGMRTDSLMLGNFRVAQILSILLFALGIFLFFGGAGKIRSKLNEETDN